MRSAVACIREIVKRTRPSLCLCLAVTLVSLAGHARPVSADCVDYCAFPVITDAMDLDEQAVQLQAFGRDKLVTVSGSSLSVFSLADPSAPSLIARVEVDAWVDLAIGGSIAYCRDYSGTVYAVSLADPAEPAVLGVLDLGGAVSGLGADGNLLGVVAPDSTWSLFDVTDPLGPALLHKTACDFVIDDVDVAGGLAIVRGDGWQAYSLNPADPSTPTPIGGEVFSNTEIWGTKVLACAVRGNTVVMYMNQWYLMDMYYFGDVFVNELSLWAIDVSIPGNPQPIASVSLGSYYGGYCGNVEAANLTLVDGLVFVSHGDVGLYDLDAGLTLRAAIAAGGTVGPLAAGTDHVYVIIGARLATYATPHPLVDNTWRVPLTYAPYRWWTDGAKAGSGWFAIWSHHLGSDVVYGDVDIYNVAYSNTSPVRRFEYAWEVFYDVEEYGSGFLMVHGHLPQPRMSWVDMADPQHPGNPQSVPITGVFGLGVGASGLVAAICADPWPPEELRIYDLTNHESPILLGTIDFGPSGPGGPLWQGNLVLVPTADGLQVVDAQDPAAPVVRSTVPIGAASWVRPAGGTRVLAGNDRVLHLIDLADPAAPVIVSSMQDLSGVTDARMVDGIVYVANGGINALNPSTLEALGLLAPEHSVMRLLDLGDTLLGVPAGTTGGTVELPVHAGIVSVAQGPSDPPRTSVARLSMSPNPFSPRTTASFTLPVAGLATLAIYDARGHEVARLVDKSMPAGPHGIDWSGVTASGQIAPSGTYFCRLTTPWGVETRKVQLVR